MKNVIVKIFSSVVESLIKSSNLHSPNETGGVLVGTRQFIGNNIEFSILGVLCIADVEEFQKSYEATRGRFICKDKEMWGKFIYEAVQKYGMSYIGDWHTHPNSHTYFLSNEDASMLTDQYTIGQFYPFPPLHLLVQWPPASKDIMITANVMTSDNLILVIKPKVIKKGD